MNRSTAIASGTKPSQLSSTVPGVDEVNVSQAGIEAELASIPKQPQQQAAREPAQIDPAEAEWLASVASQPDNTDLNYRNDGTPEGAAHDAALAARSSNSAKTMVADAVDQGIPAVVSAAGGIAGAAIGTGLIPGMGTAAGYEAGSIAGGAINVALAPAYKNIANKIRDFYGIPKDQQDDFNSRMSMAIQEGINAVLPRFIGAGKAVADKMGAKLAATQGEKVAENLATMQAAKDAGIELGPRGMVEGTQLESTVGNQLEASMAGVNGEGFHDDLFLAQQNNDNAVVSAFKKLKSQVGEMFQPDGTRIIKPENVKVRKEAIGAEVGSINEEAFALAEGRTFDPTNVISEFRKSLELRGIDTSDGMIPPSILNNLEPDAKSIATRYNRTLSKINAEMMESGSGMTLPEQLAKLKDTQLNPGQSFYTDGTSKYRGMSLKEIHGLTDDMQKLAEFDSFNRQLKQKQFGKISHEARTLRDKVTKTVFDDAALRAEESGSASQAKRLKGQQSRLDSLNKSYGDHADAELDFYNAVNADAEKSTELIMRSLGENEYNHLVDKVLTAKEKGALKSAYIENMIKKSSEEGTALDPKQIMKTIERDGARAKKLFGDADYSELKKLAGYLKTAPHVDSNLAGAEKLAGSIVRTVNKLTSGHGMDLVEQGLFRSPKIRDMVKNMPAYQAAFKKYYGTSTAERMAKSTEMLAEETAKRQVVRAGKVVSNVSQSSERQKESELKALDL